MKTLALDTSTAIGSVAILDGEQILSCMTWERGKSHSESATTAVNSCLQKAFLTAKDLQLIALGKGPGSFTGIRVAVNIARSFAFLLQIPVVALETAEILAAQVSAPQWPVIVGINAYNGQLYTSHLELCDSHWILQSPTQSCTPEDTLRNLQGPHLFLGDGYDLYPDIFANSKQILRSGQYSDLPDARHLARLGQHKASQNQTLDWNELQPLYIRASAAEEKLQAGQLKRPFRIE